jgi:hypothetical protein
MQDTAVSEPLPTAQPGPTGETTSRRSLRTYPLPDPPDPYARLSGRHTPPTRDQHGLDGR